MRKIQTIVAILLLASLFTSCRKTYTCVCATNYRKLNDKLFTQTKYDLNEYDRKSANVKCKSRQTKFQHSNGTYQTTTCVLE
jgi:hypothetical protein